MRISDWSSDVCSSDLYAAEALVGDINRASAAIARRCADEFAAKDGRPRFVAGAIGPTNKTLSLSPDVEDPGYREIDFDYLKGVYREQIDALRSEEHTSELQSLMRISYAVFCLNKTKENK